MFCGSRSAEVVNVDMVEGECGWPEAEEERSKEGRKRRRSVPRRRRVCGES